MIGEDPKNWNVPTLWPFDPLFGVFNVQFPFSFQFIYEYAELCESLYRSLSLSLPLPLSLCLFPSPSASLSYVNHSRICSNIESQKYHYLVRSYTIAMSKFTYCYLRHATISIKKKMETTSSVYTIHTATECTSTSVFVYRIQSVLGVVCMHSMTSFHN